MRRPWYSAQVKQSDPFYQTRTWKGLRAVVMLRDKGLCQYCLRKGLLRSGNIGDHILPRRFFPELEDKESNVVCCCEACHSVKRRIERDCGDRFQTMNKIKESGFFIEIYKEIYNREGGSNL